MREHFVGRRGAGQDRHAATHVEQVPRDVPLHAVVEGHDVRAEFESVAVLPAPCSSLLALP